MPIINGKLTKESAELLYHRFFRNKCFEIQQDIQDLQDMLRIFGGDSVVLLDKFIMVSDQLNLMHRDSSELISRVDKLKDYINIE
jgi:hypothetical protein